MLAWIYSKLARLYPNQTFPQFSELLLGKVLGKLITLLYLLTIVFASGLILWNLGNFLVTFVLIETPAEIIILIFILLVIAASRFGIGTLGKASDIFFPLFVGLFVLLIVSVSPQINVLNIQPVLEKGASPVIKSFFPYLGYPYLELSLFLMFTPYVKQKEKITKAFCIGLLIGGVVLAILTVMSILVLGVETTASRMYPSYLLAQKINIAGFFSRVEIVIAILWFVSIFFQLTISFNAMSICLAQLIGVGDYKRLVFPLGGILFVLPFIIVPNTSYVPELDITTWWVQTSISGLVIPLLLLGIALIRKRIKGS